MKHRYERGQSFQHDGFLLLSILTGCQCQLERNRTRAWGEKLFKLFFNFYSCHLRSQCFQRNAIRGIMRTLGIFCELDTCSELVNDDTPAQLKKTYQHHIVCQPASGTSSTFSRPPSFPERSHRYPSP